MRRVFDDNQPVLVGQPKDSFHRTRVPAVVENYERFRRRRDRSFDIGRVEVEIVCAEHVAEHGPRARVRDRVRCRNEVQGRQDYLVAWATTRGYERKMKGRRAARDSKSMSRARELGEGRFEVGHPWAHAPPPRGDNLSNRLEHGRIDLEIGQWHRPRL